MFDIAYESEATITAAEIQKEKEWNKLLRRDLSKNFAWIKEMFEISRYNEIIKYWSIMLETHGT